MNSYFGLTTSHAAYALLDTLPEDCFDNFTLLAARLLKAPVSLISVIDFDNERQFFKSEFGLGSPWSETRQTPILSSFCQYVVEDDKPLLVSDARVDDRVKDNPAIELLNVIAYLGVPVYAATGEPIASLCVIDHAPREWSDEDVDTLLRLARGVDDQLRLIETAETLETLRAYLDSERDHLSKVLETVPTAILSVNQDGRILLANTACRDVLGISEQEIASRKFDDTRWVVEAVDGSDLSFEDLPIARVLKTNEPIRDYRHIIVWPDGQRRVLSVNATPTMQTQSSVAVVCSVEDVTEQYDLRR